MKRIGIVFGVVIILLAMLVSCDSDIAEKSISDENIKDENIELSDEPIVGMNAIDTSYRLKYCDGALYFLIGSSYRTKSPLETFWRYNVRTGNLTAVCGDPVCQHTDKSCPFYAMDSRFAIYQDNIVYDRIFFLKRDQKNGNSYFENVIFDMKTRKTTQLSETEGMIQSAHVTELYSDHYRFFYTWVENEDTKEYYFSLCRMNLDDGKVVVLRENASAEEGLTAIPNHSMANIMLFAVEERIYFNNGGEIYSTDFNLENKEVILTGRFATDQICTDGEFIYWGERETDNSNILTLYRSNLDGSEKTALGIRTYRFTLTKKYIYYEDTEVVTLGKDGRSGSIGGEIKCAGSALYRAAHDGSGQEEVFRFQQGDTFYELVYACYVGDYVYATYYTYTDTNGNGTIEDSEEYQSIRSEDYTLLRVDLNTGEMDFIRCGTENRETP